MKENISPYFSHDANARNSTKILELRAEMGVEGYGIYFILLERLRSADEFKEKINFKALKFEMNDAAITEEKIRKVIEDFDLFEIENGYFYSKGMMERMELMKLNQIKRSEAGRKAANARWQKVKEEKEEKEEEAKESQKAKMEVIC